ncbi:MAG: lysylphosphatidylglycerol synthase transmembrane domain-containing protein [Candidatus Polarisedimenticolia bacterium]|nr:flippase-like domain-containing protein [bacterium]
MKRAIGIAAGALLAAVCLWLFFRGVDGAALGRSLREANPLLIALLCLSSVGHMALRAWRWRTLLGEEGRGVPYGELFSAVCIGYMAGVLPGRVSEVLRPAALSRRTRAPFGAALATVGAERFLLDLPMIVLFGGVFLALPSGFGGLPAGVDDKLIAEVRAAGLVLALASVAGLAFVSWLARRREAADALIASWAAGHGSFVCKIAAFLRTLLPGLQGFGSARGLARLGAETAAIWLVICAGIHCGVASCGVSLPLFASLIIVPVTALGIAVPTPGGAGTYHMAMKLVLVGLFGASEAGAVGAGLVAHAAPLLVTLALGGFFALRGGLGARKAVGEAAP